ncbi:Protein of unknown function [Gryllus bimaculatus]|nr:Protein of unknown function [Gryllus bimaculatus]
MKYLDSISDDNEIQMQLLDVCTINPELKVIHFTFVRFLGIAGMHVFIFRAAKGTDGKKCKMQES